jgi:hypothetical protein
MALRLQRSQAWPEAEPAPAPLPTQSRRGGSLASMNRDRFVRTASVLVGLLVAALIVMMVLLPDRLSRVAEIFLR